MEATDSSVADAFAALLSSIESLRATLPSLPASVTPYLLSSAPGLRASHRELLAEASSVYGKRLEHLDSLLQTLVSCRTMLHQHCATIDNALAPITALPVELLQLIFHTVVDDTLGYHEGIHTATALSQVCRQWNAVASSMPLLWANFNMLHHMKPRYPFALLENALERSVRAPRSLSVNDKYLCQWPKALLHNQTFRNTLRDLSISDGSQEELSFLHETSVLDHEFPNLEKLYISLDGSTIHDPLWLNPDKFRAPRLSDLYLRNVSLEEFSFVEGSLTVLHLTNMELDEFWDVLSTQWLHLERLTIICCFWRDSPPVVTMPELKYLEIKDMAYGPSSQIVMFSLVTPSLRHLRLLRIRNLERTSSTLFDYSSQAPNLQILEVYNMIEGINAVVETFAIHPHMFPNLHRLFLSLLPHHTNLGKPESSALCTALKTFIASRLTIPSVPSALIITPISHLRAPNEALEHERQWFQDHVETVRGQSLPLHP